MTVPKSSFAQSILSSNLSRRDKLQALKDLEEQVAAFSRASNEGMLAPDGATPIGPEDARAAREARYLLRDPALDPVGDESVEAKEHH